MRNEASIISKLRILYLIPAFVLAAFFVAGEYFFDRISKDGSMSLTTKVILLFLLSLVIYYFILSFAELLLDKLAVIKTDNNRAVFSVISSYPLIFTFIFLMICWSLPLILKYPAGICWDASWQIEQGLGTVPLSTHHPIFHSLMMGTFVKAGMAMGSANMGIFAFVLVETIVFALIVAYGVKTACKWGAPNWSVVLILLFFAFSPYVTGYIGQVIKDVYFTAFSILFILLVADYAINNKVFWSNQRKVALLLVAALFMMLFRNNGIYIIVGSAICMIIAELFIYRNREIIHIVLILMLIVVPAASEKALETIYQPEQGSVAEALSLPIQQTSRYVVKHYDEMTDEEKQTIAQVLPLDEIPDLYNPYISDPVKNLFNKDASSRDVADYLKVWAKDFANDPTCYIAATWEQNVMLFYPMQPNYAYYLNCNSDRYEYNGQEPFSTPDTIEKLQGTYWNLLVFLHTAPVLRTINNMAVYIMIAFALLFLCIAKRQYYHLIYYVPIILSVLVIIAAPCIRWHVRYSFPIIYMVPFLLALYIIGIKSKEVSQ